MKHKRLTALVLAAALVLAGCGGTKSSSGSAAASQSTGSSQNAPAIAVQKERIMSSSRWKKPSGTSGHHPEADHPCAAACVRQPGC